MNVLQAVILGIIQGLTEFIPISSSAHLIIVPWLFGWEDKLINSLTFDVALHLGTLIAVLAYFARDWVRLIKAWPASTSLPSRQGLWPPPSAAICASSTSCASCRNTRPPFSCCTAGHWPF